MGALEPDQPTRAPSRLAQFGLIAEREQCSRQHPRGLRPPSDSVSTLPELRYDAAGLWS